MCGEVPPLRWRNYKNPKRMNIENQINATKSRIDQIETSDLFSPEEKEQLLHSNKKRLESLQTQKKELRSKAPKNN